MEMAIAGLIVISLGIVWYLALLWNNSNPFYDQPIPWADVTCAVTLMVIGYVMITQDAGYLMDWIELML